MSFNFQWPTFSEAFQNDAASMLTSALNRGPKPKVIADDINVEDINMGTIPPDLEILEIGELSTDRFRGIFRLTYAGDAHLTLSTKVQANPLTRPTPDSTSYNFEDASSVFPSSMPSRGILFAARPLVVPMKLRLSSVRLKAIVVLVVSKQKGITLVFKNDPLESVDVSSTFDSVAVIQKYLQQEIEGQLREMFREDLPGIIHRLSQRWLSGKRNEKDSNAMTNNLAKTTKNRSTLGAVASPHPFPGMPSSPTAKSTYIMNAKMSTPEKNNSRQKSNRAQSDINDTPSSSTKRSPSRRRKEEKSPLGSTSSSPRLTHKASTIFSSSPKTISRMTMSGKSKALTSPNFKGKSSSLQDLSQPWSNGGIDEDDEQYDPTYGLRPDEVRMAIHGGGYSGLARLANQVNGGLRDLTLKEEEEEEKVAERERSALSANKASFEDDEKDDQCIGEGSKGRRDSIDIFDADSDDVPDHPFGSFEDDQHSSGEEDVEEDQSLERLAKIRQNSIDMALSETAVNGNIRRSISLFDSTSSNASPKGKEGVSRTLSLRAASTLTSKIRQRSRSDHDKVEYETIPAVGGGIITRPRIYHSASRVQAPEVEDQDEGDDLFINNGSIAASSTARAPSSSRSRTVRPFWNSEISQHKFTKEEGEEEGEGVEEANDEDQSLSDMGDDTLATLSPEPMDPKSSKYKTQVYRQQFSRTYRAEYHKNTSSSSGISSDLASKNGRSITPGWSTSRSSTAPTSTYLSNNNRRSSDHPFNSTSSTPERNKNIWMKSHQYNALQSNDISPLRPSTLANSQSMTIGASHHFMDLVNSNHTLSPYTRILDTKGFAVRSHPVTPSTGSGGETSSSVGGGLSGSKPICSGLSGSKPTCSSSSMNQYANEGSRLERQKSVPKGGGGKRRVFRLGGGTEADGDGGGIDSNRPKPSPLQPVRVGVASRRAHSASSLQFTPTNPSQEDRDEKGNVVRRRSKTPVHSERGFSMSSIRE